MAHGPGLLRNEIELNQFDVHDQQPLLNNSGYFDMQPPSGPYQQRSGSPRGTPPQYPSPSASYVQNEGYREAPVHRPYPPSRQGSNFASASDDNVNMAGRGLQGYRGY